MGTAGNCVFQATGAATLNLSAQAWCSPRPPFLCVGSSAISRHGPPFYTPVVDAPDSSFGPVLASGRCHSRPELAVATLVPVGNRATRPVVILHSRGVKPLGDGGCWIECVRPMQNTRVRIQSGIIFLCTSARKLAPCTAGAKQAHWKCTQRHLPFLCSLAALPSGCSSGRHATNSRAWREAKHDGCLLPCIYF